MTTFDSIKRILCPYDFTEACKVSLRESVVLAAKLGAELHVLHVAVTPPMVVLTPGESLPSPPIDHGEFLAAVKKKRLPELEAELAKAGGSVKTTVVFRDGLHADLSILEYADVAAVDLIVMAKHARAALSRLLLGSTTERVLRHASCAVLVVPVPTARKTS